MSGEAGARAGGRRIVVLLEYDGTAYSGSQYQDNGPSIQAELESSIGKLTGVESRAAFAGRTDAGVHALGQVAAFDTNARLTPDEFVRGLNHYLPPDIAVQAAREVDASFDPRRDARVRSYQYRIDTGAERSPLKRNRVWQIGRPLDAGAMQRAARRLEGEHDFAAFAGPYEGSTKRTLRRCVVGESAGTVTVEMEAKAFLPHQVRRTVGPLAEIGAGRLSEAQLVGLLEDARPSSAGPAAPACGLYLVRVEYDGLDFEAGKGNRRDE